MVLHEGSAYLYLTTTGRRTRVPREIEIWFTHRNHRYFVISERYENAQWVKNIRADPRVRWRVGSVTFTGRAHVVDPVAEPELTEAIQMGSRRKYGWGEGLIVVLMPDPTD